MGKTKLGVGVKTKYCLHLCFISNDDSEKKMSEVSVKTVFYVFYSIAHCVLVSSSATLFF